MMKMTLLEMVQNILSALTDDEVNSITDTVSSIQVAEIIKETYYEQFNNILIPEFRKLVRLESVSDVTRPNYLKIPSKVLKIEDVKYRDYRNNNKLKSLSYVDPIAFLEARLQLDSNSHNVFLTKDPDGIEYFIKTDKAPSCYTIFDDQFLAMDSFDQEFESVLQTANNIAYAQISEEFLMENDYVPPIDANLFPLLLAEAKSVAFINLNQISSSKEEQRARRQRIRMQNDKFRSKQAQRNYINQGPNFARNR